MNEREGQRPREGEEGTGRGRTRRRRLSALGARGALVRHRQADVNGRERFAHQEAFGTQRRLERSQLGVDGGGGLGGGGLVALE